MENGGLIITSAEDKDVREFQILWEAKNKKYRLRTMSQEHALKWV